jgi:GNAT superfamily N-acetyltransferase
LILAYLLEIEGDGYDYLPTLENAEMLFTVGLGGVYLGDPVVLAEDNEEPIGWTSWIRAVSHLMEFRDRVCLGMGTYVVPSCRRMGIAKELHLAAEAIARQAGFTRIDRIGNKKGERMLLRDGWKPAAIVYQKVL